MNEPVMVQLTVGNQTFRTAHFPLATVRAIHGRGTVCREYTSLKPTKAMCSGCYDNHYNCAGNSQSGECWSFSSAKVVDKIGYTSIHVGYGPDGIMKKTLNCWHAVRK